ncbi:MAG: SEC-C metal-binding domain-containing protein [Acidobacteriota bacterium]|nr:SEC-C metal-binding domain-containing protein [Acidobacteriota bacterium]
MKRKNKRRRVPDDVLRWGPIELARFGRITFARNLLSPDEFRKHVEQLAQQVPNVVTAIDARVSRIADIVSATKPDELLLRAWWAFAVQHLTVQAETDIGNDHVVAMRMIDYIQSVIAAVPPAPEQAEPDEEVLEELKKNVDELFTLVNGPYMATRTAQRKVTDPAYDEKHEEMYFKSQVYWTTVRGDRYPVHLIEQLRDFLTPQNDILQEVLGVSASDIVAAVEGIEFSLTLGVNKLKDDFAAFQNDVLAAIEEDVATGVPFTTAAELAKYSIEKRGWAERRDDVFGRLNHFGLFDLQKITKLPATVLRELAWEPGEEASFFSGCDMKGWPLREWPIDQRPFLHVGGRFYCFDLYAVRDHFYRVIWRTVIRIRPDLKQAWEDRQREASESIAVSLISKLLGGAQAYAPAYYQWPPTKSSAKNWCECDGVVIADLDEHLFIVEVKAGAFTYTAPTNDFPAHIASAKNLIDRPLSQGRRFLDYLNSAAEVPVFDAHHNELGHIRRDQFKSVTICGITVDALTELAAQAEHLKPMGVDVGTKASSWAISIDDLRVMRDLFPNPLVFLHYLTQRRRAVEQTAAIKVDDELDHLGLYFTHNNYLQQALRISCDEPTIWHGYRDRIDQYYQALLVDGLATRPGQKLPPILQQVIDRLAVQHDRGRARAAAALLDLDSASRQQLSILLDTAILRQRLGSQPAPASVYGTATITIFCWREGVVPRDAAYARDMTLGLASLAGEESRLLFELILNADGEVADVAFDWLRPDSIASEDRVRIDAIAETTYRLRVNSQRKIGRNKPCPCGSLKKYKKCHGS